VNVVVMMMIEYCTHVVLSYVLKWELRSRGGRMKMHFLRDSIPLCFEEIELGVSESESK